MNDEPRWLDDTEQHAWLSLLAIVLVGFPELERTFRPHGLVHVEYGLLAALSNAEDGLRLSDLAGQMNMSASRLSHRMRKLVDLGYVEISGDACDGRVSIARVTEPGRRFAEQVAPAHVADVRRLIFDHLDHDQTAALADALGAVAGKLGDTCPGAPKGLGARSV
ncbi:MarR family transcriptional regulator [Dactylosporangium sp. AC04546]|uniref:MarR family winged helix-turn-helix transcriptional regulator n=1 Tax=Dactylosporangium sp. AC04546 TaxID=2862460 RepID=UPI001EDF1F8A|nr:MarR family transcriptional regulator [Dactylosporangium sp. AC04546]WVK85081.1 MarR family transcriptional regulator [Dactylosporangium sp. AC04546]